MMIPINGSKYVKTVHYQYYTFMIPRSWVDRARLINQSWYEILAEHNLDDSTMSNRKEVYCFSTIEYNMDDYHSIPVLINESLTYHIRNISVDDYDATCGLIDFLIVKAIPQKLSHHSNHLETFKESIAHV